ncbi:MAG: hypothetical protein ATN31_10585 [Candidatus Epulonipiscioides saccharophilum]|nr:MAG: hypothetical protein ATN31_10585 [Epulopiscium sp. AS2M-Bin001]
MKLVVLSFDSLQNIDLNTLFKLPNFAKLRSKVLLVENLKEVYPTLTYPIHTSIITGKYPCEHGISHNQKSDLYPRGNDFNIMGEQWFWHANNITCKTLFDYAQENNLSIASLCWPVTAGEKRGINIPEIWPLKGVDNQNYELYKSNCSEIAFEKYFEDELKFFAWKDNADMVMYLPELGVKILRDDQPDILLVHFIWLDHLRHVFGNSHHVIEEGLRYLDVMLGRYIDASKLSGNFEDTNFIILGDHGQIDINNCFNLNVAFFQKGLIRLTDKNLPERYVAYAFSAGFSAQIILKNPDDQKSVDRVYKVLLELQAEYPQYIEKVFTKEEALAEGLSGHFSFVVEAAEGTLFDMNYSGELITTDSKLKATHGHHTNKGSKPPLIAFGKSIEPNVIKNANMIDVFPTILKLLDIKPTEKLEGTSLI